MVGEGDVNFLFDKQEVIFKCKHVADFKENLSSLSNLVRKFDIPFLYENPFEGANIFCKQTKCIVHSCNLTNGIYPIPFPMRMIAIKSVATNRTAHSVKWNSIPVHIGPIRLSNSSLLVYGVDQIDIADIKEHQCFPCIESTTERSPIPTSKKKVIIPLDSTHTDISERL